MGGAVADSDMTMSAITVHYGNPLSATAGPIARDAFSIQDFVAYGDTDIFFVN